MYCFARRRPKHLPEMQKHFHLGWPYFEVMHLFITPLFALVFWTIYHINPQWEGELSCLLFWYWFVCTFRTFAVLLLWTNSTRSPVVALIEAFVLAWFKFFETNWTKGLRNFACWPQNLVPDKIYWLEWLLRITTLENSGLTRIFIWKHFLQNCRQTPSCVWLCSMNFANQLMYFKWSMQ